MAPRRKALDAPLTAVIVDPLGNLPSVEELEALEPIESLVKRISDRHNQKILGIAAPAPQEYIDPAEEGEDAEEEGEE